MSKKRLMLAAGACWLLMVVLGMVVYAQRLPTNRRTTARGHSVPKVYSKREQASAFPQNAVAPAVRGLNPADVLPWSVSVDFTLNLDPQSQALYQQMATAISAYIGVPNDRLNYYSAVNNPPNWVIGGWGGLVHDVEPDGNGGYVVTVLVNPDLSATPYGTGVTISTDYSERYSVDANNNVQYLGFLDPGGWAGQQPFVIVE